MKIAFGLLLAFAIGSICQLSGIPSPAPPAIMGALLVLSMTIGYLLTDKYAANRSKETEPLCGGPNGETSSGGKS